MKSFLALLLCLHLLTGGLLFGEIARLPDLVAHFQEHKQEKKDTTLLEYLRLHYFDSSHLSDPAHTRHHSLPFHHSGAHIVTAFACPVPELEEPLFLQPCADADALSAANYYYCRYLPVGFTGSLFQPPRA
ncbi:MAG TPA: hypothetical protein PK971_08075 [Saprospiraceae bacterium]|nr:hypothetical protein [Saprospiraceae bacterium]HND88270.1 hypothetical protein [Saprospiraceae bacterium]